MNSGMKGYVAAKSRAKGNTSLHLPSGRPWPLLWSSPNPSGDVALEKADRNRVPLGIDCAPTYDASAIENGGRHKGSAGALTTQPALLHVAWGAASSAAEPPKSGAIQITSVPQHFVSKNARLRTSAPTTILAQPHRTAEEQWASNRAAAPQRPLKMSPCRKR